jgi:branched-chain amino acid transport system substrate-binding protein
VAQWLHCNGVFQSTRLSRDPNLGRRGGKRVQFRHSRTRGRWFSSGQSGIRAGKQIFERRAAVIREASKERRVDKVGQISVATGSLEQRRLPSAHPSGRNSPRGRPGSGWRLATVACAAVITVTACGSSGSKLQSGTANPTTATSSDAAVSGTRASAPGITKTTINLGLLTSVTGAYSSSFGPVAVKAFEARLDAVNAQGGIHGRKLVVTVGDDQSSPTTAATATQDLLSKRVFAIGANSPVFFGAYRAAAAGDVPVAGVGIDGPEWGDPANKNLFAIPGSWSPTFPTYDSYGKFLKSQGVTKMAVLAYGVSPTSIGSAKALLASAAEAGVGSCFADLSVPVGGVDFSTQALAMKAAGCNGVYMPAVESTDLALVNALRNAGVPMKAEVFSTGYGQTTLNQAAKAAQGVDFMTWYTPIDRPNAGVDAELHQLKQYAGLTGPPDFAVAGSWIMADLIVAGLEAAGPNPTRASFEAALRRMTNYDANGALSGPDNLSAAAIGDADATIAGGTCWYVAKLTGSAFRTLFRQPYCGKEIPGTKNA